MAKVLIYVIIISVLLSCKKQDFVEYQDVQIIRDKWGVPHIFGKKDRDVVYGLAWAQCEDDFITLQEQLLAAKGMLGEVKGKEGITIDFAIKFMQLREEVDKRYSKDISGKHKEMLTAFVNGINTFAALHPDELLLENAFPVTEKDLLVAYSLALVDISGAGSDLRKILSGTVESGAPKGSNAIAISGRITDSGHTFLAVNSHQPMEGWYSWYEVHLKSDEGLNILGGTFLGGFVVFHGVNEYVGWAHTVNHPDLSDVYKLIMHPEKEDHYIFDGQVKKLKSKKYWSWLKIWGPLKIPIGRTIYESEYGPTFKTDQGFFAWRFIASRTIASNEQWMAMNKARNLAEFKEALAMQKIPATNIVYADRYDDIFYISNANIPVRDPAYQWDTVLPGDTSATLWKENYWSLDALPQVENPKAGYVFNTNNSPYNATHPLEDPEEPEMNDILGYQDDSLYNNRSLRFLQLIQKYDTLSYQDFKSIKFDRRYPDTLATPEIVNLELIFQLEEDKYPEIARALQVLNGWNREASTSSEEAPLFFFTFESLRNNLKSENRYTRGGKITEDDAYQAVLKAQKKMLEKYGKLSLPLGNIQRHIRGNINLSLGGGPDVLAAIYWEEQDDGRSYKGVAGESYILLAQFSDKEVIIETINAYGSSAESDSPHYTDQMEMFVGQELKPMSLDMEKAFAEAKSIYHPLMIMK